MVNRPGASTGMVIALFGAQLTMTDGAYADLAYALTFTVAVAGSSESAMTNTPAPALLRDFGSFMRRADGSVRHYRAAAAFGSRA